MARTTAREYASPADLVIDDSRRSLRRLRHRPAHAGVDEPRRSPRAAARGRRTTLAHSANSPGRGAVADRSRQRYAIQFHPEVVAHAARRASCWRTSSCASAARRADWTMENFIEREIERIRAQVGSGGVVCGPDAAASTRRSPAALIHRAIGDQLTCIFVDNGVLRRDEATRVMQCPRRRVPLPHQGGRRRRSASAQLAGVEDPEKKRRTIGVTFVEVFEERGEATCATSSSSPRARSIPTSSSRCRSKGRRRRSRAITTSAACPSACASTLVEPLRELFKDEVRRARRWCSAFPPSPSSAAIPSRPRAWRSRILGAVDRRARRRRRRPPTPSSKRRSAPPAGTTRVWQAFAVLLPCSTVGVMGDERTYEHVLAIRVVEIRRRHDRGLERACQLELLARMSSRASSTK